MKRPRQSKPKPKPAPELPDALAAYGERFMSMFDDYDEEQAAAAAASDAKRAKHNSEQPSSDEEGDGSGGSSSSSGASSDSSQDEGAGQQQQQQQQQSHRQAGPSQRTPGSTSAADSKLEAFLSGGKGNRRGSIGKGAAAGAAAQRPSSQEQLAAQERQQQQQRLLERQLKRQFMSCKVDKIFSGVDAAQLAAADAAAAADADEAYELTPEQFAAMKRDVEQLGATALDKRSAKAYKAAMLAKLGASADKRPRIPAKQGLGMAKKAKQREAVALQEAIAAGMVKAKGRGKKQRALKAKQRDKGLMEAGPGFKNGVLRLPKSALRS